MSNRDMKLLMENWRVFINEENTNAPVDPQVKNIAKELATLTSREIQNSANEIEASIQKGKQQAPQKGGVIEEEGLLLASSIALAAPAILKLVSKIGKFIGKKFGAKMKEENFLDHLAHDIHEGYLSFIEKAISFIPSLKNINQQQKRKMAEGILACVVAYLMVQSGVGVFKAIKTGSTFMATLESALTAIKEGELAVFLSRQVARASTAA